MPKPVATEVLQARAHAELAGLPGNHPEALEVDAAPYVVELAPILFVEALQRMVNRHHVVPLSA